MKRSLRLAAFRLRNLPLLIGGVLLVFVVMLALPALFLSACACAWLHDTADAIEARARRLEDERAALDAEAAR